MNYWHYSPISPVHKQTHTNEERGLLKFVDASWRFGWITISSLFLGHNYWGLYRAQCLVLGLLYGPYDKIVWYYAAYLDREPSKFLVASLLPFTTVDSRHLTPQTTVTLITVVPVPMASASCCKAETALSRYLKLSNFLIVWFCFSDEYVSWFVTYQANFTHIKIISFLLLFNMLNLQLLSSYHIR